MIEAKRVAAKGQAHVVPYGERRCKEHQHDWLTFDDLHSTFAETGAEIVKLRDETALVRWQRVPAGESLAGLQTIQDAVYIPGFVAVAGSAVKQGEGADLDLILRRAGRDESLEVLLLNEIQTALGRRVDLHYTYNASGPHGPHLPLYELVLVRRPTIELVDVPVVERARAAEQAIMPPERIGQWFAPAKSAEAFDTLEEAWAKWGKQVEGQYARRPTKDHDPQGRDLHPPLPLACPTHRLHADPSLRAVGQP